MPRARRSRPALFERCGIARFQELVRRIVETFGDFRLLEEFIDECCAAIASCVGLRPRIGLGSVAQFTGTHRMAAKPQSTV